MSASTAGLVRTLVAVSLVTLLLAAALAWPRRGLLPVRSTTFELDEPSESPHAAQNGPT